VASGADDRQPRVELRWPREGAGRQERRSSDSRDGKKGTKVVAHRTPWNDPQRHDLVGRRSDV